MNRTNPVLKEYFGERAREIIRRYENSREKNGDIFFTIQIPREMSHLIREGDKITLSEPAGEVYFSEDENKAVERGTNENGNLIGYFFPQPKTFYDLHPEKLESAHVTKPSLSATRSIEDPARIFRHPWELRGIE